MEPEEPPIEEWDAWTGEQYYPEEEQPVATQQTFRAVNVVRIRRINVYESPILSLSCNGTTIHVVIDTGATSSCITLDTSNRLELRVMPTLHTALMVDGGTPLDVAGELHTTYYRGKIPLTFSGLIVSSMSVDILGGNNFVVENDLSLRPKKNAISIGDLTTVMTTPPSVLQMEKQDARLRLVTVNRQVTVVPGDPVQLRVPFDMPSNGHVQAEPNCQQTKPFFEPRIVPVVNGVLNLKKNCQIAKVRRVYDTDTFQRNAVPPSLPPVEPVPLEEVLRGVTLDDAGNLPEAVLKYLQQVIADNLEVFQEDFPSYNQSFGELFATINFNSNTRPPPPKLRMPAYSKHGQWLLMMKFLEMIRDGVLKRPQDLGVEPLYLSNCWMVLKPSSAGKPPDQCKPEDVRIVTGYDGLNPYLKQKPGKVTPVEQVFTSIASWKVMGQIDYKNMFWQVPIKNDTPQDGHKQGYLAVRTPLGTYIMDRSPQGLLGMSETQDELLDLILGDLVASGDVVIKADNIFFGSSTPEEAAKILSIILTRCKMADFRVKPSKV